jgi:hypothetical protein
MKSIMIVFLDWFEEPMNHTTPIFMSIAPALATRRRTTLHQQLHPPPPSSLPRLRRGYYMSSHHFGGSYH